jgi:hypothetical protein
VRKPQWITACIAVILVVVIFKLGKTVLPKKAEKESSSQVSKTVTIDSILIEAKKHLSKEQVVRLNGLENSISRGNVKEQQLNIYHQLAHFWSDTAGIFEPFAWYEAEAARLENSEKNLTFAAHLFLNNLQEDQVLERRQWKAFQAKDLFERSLKINPGNDSSKVGLGACYIYGNISATPMEGISKIMEVVNRDSSNVYAQVTLAKGSIISGQYDKATNRLLTVNRLSPADLESILLLADLYERIGDKSNAVIWYKKSLDQIKRPDYRQEIEKRIETLGGKQKN